MRNSPTDAERDIRFHLHAQTNPASHEDTGPLIITRGDGPYVFDSEGRRYLDAMAGLWSASLGFGHPRLKSAAAEAYEAMGFYHTFGGRSSPAAIDAAEAIANLAPIEEVRIFFATSGSEANETMVKLAWLYHAANGEPGRRKIIARKRSFHGSTIVTASLTGLPHMHREFGLPLPGFLHTEAPDLYRGLAQGETIEQYEMRLAAELERLILSERPDTIAAMIAEPVQAGAGVLVPPAGYFPKIQAVLDRYGILMLDDEVVCGFGRTGRWFGCESVGMKPDMMSMAKGLSSAHFPISAVAISPRVYEAVQRFNQKGDNFGHGFTNSGHPVGAAIVRETIAVYKEMELLDRVAALGAALERAIREAVADSPIVRDIRTRGLLAGAELADRASKASFPPALKVGQIFDQAARAKGLMVRLQGETISFCPPFILTDEQVVEIGQAFAAALRETERQVAAAKAA